MANNWLIEQIIDLQHGVQAPLVWPNALMLCGDNNAHTWRVTIMDGGESAQITGNITGYFVRTDGNTVTVTGGLTGNVATVTLPQACYATDGDLYAVMRLKSSSGTITLSALILPVRNVLTDSIIDPGEVIPSLDDLLAQIDACEEATDAANDAADAANQAAQSASAVESDIESAEAARVTAEQGRVAAEQARAAAEAERVANEAERQQQLTNAINAAEADADRAEAAADAAETLIAMPPLFSDTPPMDEPTLNKLWVDTGVSPTMMRRWRGADVPTEREYTETRVGCGKNLLNDASIVSANTENTTVMIDGHAIRIQGTGATYRSGHTHIYLPAGTYTIKADIAVTSGVARIARRASTDGGRTYPSTMTDGAPSGANGYTFTVERGGEWNRISFYATWATAEDGDVTYSNIRLYAGTDATEFVPYEDIPFLALDNAQGQISQVEVEVGCDVTSKNMIDINSLTTPVNTSLSVTMDQLRVYTTGDGGAWKGGSTGGFVLRKGISYTLSAQLVEYVSGDAYIAIRNASDNTIISALSLDFGKTPARMSKTYTPDSNMTVYFTAFCSNNSILTGDVTYRGIQLEVGDEATAYESYKGLAGKDQISIVACGKNLVDLSSLHITATNVQMDMSDDSVHVYTTDEGGEWRGINTPDFTIFAGVTYTLSATLSSYVSGYARVGLRGADNNTFLSGATLPFGSGMGSLSATFTPEADEEVYLSLLCTNSTALTGDCTFSNIQLEIGGAATAYEPYRSMGGGTVTLTEPLYGLPGAEDTVDVSVDGDVTATHRTAILKVDGTNKSAVASTTPCASGAYAYVTSVTGVLQMEDFPALCSHFAVVPKNAPASQKVAGTMMAGLTSSSVPNIWFFSDQPSVEAFNTWLAAQSTAGTPVTLVYELATPTTETPAAVDPIVPQSEQVNLFTDGDALSATIHGSGWDTISDQTGLLATIAQLTARVAALEQAAVNESTGG